MTVKTMFNALRCYFFIFISLCCDCIIAVEFFNGNNSEFNHSIKPVNPEFPGKKSDDGNEKILLIIIITVASSAIVLTILFLLGLTILLRSRKRSNTYAQSDEERLRTSPISETKQLCRRFTLDEIRTATNNFDPDLKIGSGGSGRVYKGFIDDINKETPVAVKVINSTSSPGLRQFWMEVETVSKLRHPNLVSLIGYCNDEGSMILVYDYMAHGTLRDHLYGAKNNQPLDWNKRLGIVVGAARGLAYLHAAAEQGIIHRDVKTSNILLDENLGAKVSDFGLSRLGPESPSRSHVTTEVRGTFGYFDPDYFLTHHLTTKSDVYGFGVVMFEVLSGSPPVDMGQEDAERSLAQWAQFHVRRGTLDQIVDRSLMRGGDVDQIAPECLRLYGKTAYRCLRSDPKRRPKMADVLRNLEAAVRLQQGVDVAAEEGIMDICETNYADERNDNFFCCGGGNQVVERPPGDADAVHSCPTIRQKGKEERMLLRFLSDKVGLKWATQPTSRALRALCFTCSSYRVHQKRLQ